MDSSTLRRLADEGFLGVPAEGLSTLADWCWDWGIATGDARYSVISRILKVVDEWWGEQGIPSKLLAEVDSQLKRGLTDSLEAPDAASGAQFAHQMGMELPLVEPDGWERGGWL